MDRKKIRCISVFMLLTVLTAIVFVMNVFIGSSDISPREITDVIMMRSSNEISVGILWKIRIPRALSAMLLGGALALSGYLLQTFFHNPIAGPFVLGVSSGAKLTTAFVLIFAAGRFLSVNSFVMISAAFLGSLISLGFVLIISQKVKNMSMLVVCGVMIGYICSAVTDFAVTFADDSDIVNLHNWSMGTFSGMTMDNVQSIAIVTLTSSFAVFMLSKPIGAYTLGESYAENLGVNVKLLRIILILLSGFLSACVTAFAGPVSFVGIAVPHLIRQSFKTSKPIVLIPGCFLGGSVFCMLCDMISRTVFSPTELSISTVTAVFGAPVVIVIMLGRKKGSVNE